VPQSTLLQTFLKSDVVVHLSDIHFGEDFAFPLSNEPDKSTLLESLISDIERIAPEGVGLLVISGDLTTKANADFLFNDAISFLVKMTERLRLERDRVVIVPGNHDINLRDYKPQDYSHERVFFAAMKEFYGGLPYGLPRLHSYELSSGRRLDVLAMNSVRLRESKTKNYGYVDWSSYRDLLRRTPVARGSIKIGVLHHHLVSAVKHEFVDPDYPAAGLSLTLDSIDVIEGLQENGFDIVLHGHQHVAAVTRISRGRLADGRNRLAGLDHGMLLVGAGSAGAHRLTDELRDNAYGILKFNGRWLNVISRRFNPGLPPREHFAAKIKIRR
jgi:predicted phosphodiesterase